MSKLVSCYVSDEAYEAALYLAKLAHKDPVWVITQWISFAKDEALVKHEGLNRYLEQWRADKLRDFQHSLVASELVEPDDPPF